MRDGVQNRLAHNRLVEENLKTEQRFRLRDLLRYNLKTVRAYLLKEAFQQLWDYNSPAWAGKFLDEWCRQMMRSRIEPMKKIARSLRQHRELILNYFRAQKLLSSGVVEGLNNKAKVTMRKSYGFRTFRVPRTRALSLTWQAARAGIGRGRDAGRPAPPAQIPTSGTTA